MVESELNDLIGNGYRDIICDETAHEGMQTLTPKQQKKN